MKRYISFIIAFIAVFLFKSEINAYTEYKIGDIVPYNGMEFYVIKNSSRDENVVTMLKKEPLTVEEVNTYGVGHVNRYTDYSVGIVVNKNGYGSIAYYTSIDCGFINDSLVTSGCTTDYQKSEVKYVVDAWAQDKILSGLQEVRLIRYDELFTNLGYERWNQNTVVGDPTEDSPSFMKESSSGYYMYWTMDGVYDGENYVYQVNSVGGVRTSGIYYGYDGVIRPVITLSKTSLGDIDESMVDDTDNDDKDDKTTPNKSNNVPKNNDNKKNTSTNKKESSVKVSVANTYMKASLLIIISGFILACVSVVIYYIITKKGSKE